MTRSLRTLVVSGLVLALAAGPAFARGVRTSARTSVNRSYTRNTNVNVDRNVNVNVRGGYYGGGYYGGGYYRGGYYGGAYYRGGYYGGGYYGGCCYSPVAAAAAITATAMVVGSIVYSLPPSCTAVVVNGIGYQQCGSTWYQPQFSGSSTTYIVVNSPH